MKIDLLPVEKSKTNILNNLLEKYNYEFSQYDKIPLIMKGYLDIVI